MVKALKFRGYDSLLKVAEKFDKKLAATNTIESNRDKKALTINPDAARKMTDWIKSTIQEFVINYNKNYANNNPNFPPLEKKDLVLELVIFEKEYEVNLYSGLKYGRNTYPDSSIKIIFHSNEELLEPSVKIDSIISSFHGPNKFKELVETISEELSDAIRLPRLSQEKDLWWADDKTGKLIRPAYFGESSHAPPKISWSLVDAFNYIEEEKNTPKKIKAPKKNNLVE